VPADLAVAFILSRPLRRVRLPLELAVASVLARAAPALTRIHVMHIFRAFPGYQEPDWMKDGMHGRQMKKYWPALRLSHLWLNSASWYKNSVTLTFPQHMPTLEHTIKSDPYQAPGLVRGLIQTCGDLILSAVKESPVCVAPSP
jgi:hypothetical protein